MRWFGIWEQLGIWSNRALVRHVAAEFQSVLLRVNSGLIRILTFGHVGYRCLQIGEVSMMYWSPAHIRPSADIDASDKYETYHYN